MQKETAIAQLRHLYHQMLQDNVHSPEAAQYLLGPALEALEYEIPRPPNYEEDEPSY